MIRNLLSGIAGFMLAASSFLLAVAVHDHNQPEDLTVIWICAIQGNRECGPNQEPIMIAPDNLFRNW